MIRLNNDYNKIAHEKVLEAILKTKDEAFAGYGEDEWCLKTEKLIKKLVGTDDCEVFFIPGATMANYIVVDAGCSAIQSVICADTGHIYCHEGGSIENTGHKMIPLQNTDGKISAEQIEKEAGMYFNNGCPEYWTEPHMVYISMATEDGTMYSLKELKDISSVCKKYGMLLFVDGARLAYGLGTKDNDITLKDLAKYTDAFYFGGTKCGAMFGEALVLFNKELRKRFKTHMKRNGAVGAKSWLMGVMFYALLEDGLYFELGRKADSYAQEIREAFLKKGIKEAYKSDTNQQFVYLTPKQKKALSKDFFFEDMGEIVRFCTSWATTREEVDSLIEAINNL